MQINVVASIHKGMLKTNNYDLKKINKVILHEKLMITVFYWVFNF